MLTDAARALAAFGLAVLAAWPARGLAQSSDDWKAIEATAKKQGVVMLLHNIPPPGDEPLLRKFAEAYPDIQVEAVRLGSAALMQRFSTEAAAGVAATDVVMTVQDEQVDGWVKNGWIKAWTPPESAGYPDVYKVQGRLYAAQLYREVIIYNTNRVKADQAPKEWQDLLDPRWKGHIGLNPPWRSVTVQGALAYWDKTLGIADIAQKLKSNGVRFFNGSSGVLQAVVRGDVWIAELIDPPVISALAEGAPIGVVYPRSGVPSIPGQAMVVERAPHPEAGMVFVNWLLSKEGQTALQEGGCVSLRPDVVAPKLVPASSQLKIVLSPALLEPEYQRGMIEEFRKVFNVQ